MTGRVLGAGLLALVLGACSSGGADVNVDVYAASSLTDAFGRIETAYEATHTDVDIRLNLAGSATLATQVIEGAPADVLATADAATMARVVEAGLVTTPATNFTRNRLALAVAPGNPLGITGLEDLARADLAVAVCAPEVPCGAAATRAADVAGITIDADTIETSVRAVRSRVELGEVDVGLVYATDLSGAVEGIDLPADASAPVDYPVAAVSNRSEATDFIEYLLGPAGQATLAEFGFETAP